MFCHNNQLDVMLVTKGMFWCVKKNGCMNICAKAKDLLLHVDVVRLD